MKKYNKFLISITLILMLIGCREVNYYEYKPVSIKTMDEVLRISVNTTPKDIKKENSIITQYRAPYYISFRYTTEKTNPFYKLRVEQASITGIQSNNLMDFKNREKKKMSDKFTKHHKPDHHVLVVVLGERKKTEYIDIILKTDFKKGVRSDTVDKYMGV